MTPERLRAITARYPSLRIAVVGDFCLDRYLEIDPALAETSIETGLPVRNVVSVRAQPGGAGTIVNNLSALGVGTILPVGFRGDDGEGYELGRALGSLPGVRLDHLVVTPDRRTFTYCKPLVLEPGKPPRELERLDSKNWTPTPGIVEEALVASLRAVAPDVDALIVLEQVDRAETGVVTRRVLAELGAVARSRPDLPMLADSRRGLGDWPRLSFKLNAAELARHVGREGELPLDEVRDAARRLAVENTRPVFVTLSERGIVGATADGAVHHVPALPLRGPIDIVGAGDAVTANLATALAAGGSVPESLELAMLASSIVIHQLGTTGTADAGELAGLLEGLG